MGKKSIDRKTVTQFITDNRKAGKTDQEIYNELSVDYYDKKTLALLIMGTVTEENKNKYKLYNNILLVLIGITILFRGFYVLNLALATAQLWSLLLLFFVPIINIYCFYEVARYNGPVYRIFGGLTLIGFAESLNNGGDGSNILINLIIAGSIAGLLFYLDSNMFPKYIPGSLQKDENGEYILS